ncbi:MAG: glycosyltransferase, partial [Chitinispirillaceae bacterium]
MQRVRGEKPMRNVLHLRSSGDVLGAERVIMELGRLAKDYGYRCVIGAIHDVHDPVPRFIQQTAKLGIETVTFPASRRYDPVCIRSIHTFIAERHIDLVHCHGYKEDVYGFFAARGFPLVATNHLWKNTTLRSKTYASLDAFILRWFSGVVGVSDQIVHDMQMKGIKNPIKIANGIDCSRFRPRKKNTRIIKQLQTDSKGPVVLMVSSLSSVKGHTVALRALAEIRKHEPHVSLCIVGEGPERPQIEKTIGELELSRSVILMGSRNDISEILSIADVFLLPSFKE